MSYPGLSMNNKGIIFDIKRFTLHDGPGIRTTVFLKGCPLKCIWCHNPESQSIWPEIIMKPERCLKDCRECLPVCKSDALSKKEAIVLDRKKCTLCEECEEACPSDAIKVIGKEKTVGEILREIEKDGAFYEESGGGVTFSGGEPLMQPEFLESLLYSCKKMGMHTALDTSGHVSFSTLERIAGRVDLFLYDFKIFDEGNHKRFTGQSNKIILENLSRLAGIHQDIEIRIPLIPQMTDTDENIEAIMEFLSKFKGIRNISLLPYHRAGSRKYDRLGRREELKGIKPPSQETIESIKRKFEKNGFKVKIGG